VPTHQIPYSILCSVLCSANNFSIIECFLVSENKIAIPTSSTVNSSGSDHVIMSSRVFKKAKLSKSVEKTEILAQERHRCKKETVIDRIQLLGQKIMHLNSAAALSTSIEYYRFMAMKAEYDIDDEPSKLAPSALIDDLWHTHLLDTRSYMMLESLLLPEGGRIHHNPIKDEQADYEGRLTHTKNLYYDLYHSLPPHDIWGNEAHLESPTAQAAAQKGDISDPEEVDDGVIISEAGKEEHERPISIFVISPLGDEVKVNIRKTIHTDRIIEACLDLWHLTYNTHVLRSSDGRVHPNWALDAQDGDTLYFTVEPVGC
jgi:hypothetical protein